MLTLTLDRNLLKRPHPPLTARSGADTAPHLSCASLSLAPYLRMSKFCGVVHPETEGTRPRRMDPDGLAPRLPACQVSGPRTFPAVSEAIQGREGGSCPRNRLHRERDEAVSKLLGWIIIRDQMASAGGLDRKGCRNLAGVRGDFLWWLRVRQPAASGSHRPR